MDQTVSFEELRASAAQLSQWIKESYGVLEEMVFEFTKRIEELEQENLTLKAENAALKADEISRNEEKPESLPGTEDPTPALPVVPESGE